MIQNIKPWNKVTYYDHDKYITISEFNKLREEYFAERLAQVNLVTKTDFDTESISLNRKLTQTKQNMLLMKMN